MEFPADSEDVARTCHPHPDAVGGPAAGRHGHRRMNDSILGARDDLGALEICGRCSNSGYRAVHCRGGPFGIQFAQISLRIVFEPTFSAVLPSEASAVRWLM